MDEPIRTTNHARRRLKERAHLPARSADRIAVLAFKDGKRPDDPSISPALRAKIARGIEKNIADFGQPGIYRLYRDCLFVFSPNGALITVLPRSEETPFGRAPKQVDGVRWDKGRRVRNRQGKRPQIDLPDEDAE